jgi:hypothetical protein
VKPGREPAGTGRSRGWNINFKSTINRGAITVWQNQYPSTPSEGPSEGSFLLTAAWIVLEIGFESFQKFAASSNLVLSAPFDSQRSLMVGGVSFQTDISLVGRLVFTNCNCIHRTFRTSISFRASR